MEKQLFIGGFGGQGAALIGKMIGYAAAEEGMDSAFFPEYETAMRGGASNCTVIVSNQKIQSVVLEQFDCVSALDKRTIVDHMLRIKPGGTLIVNSSLVKDEIECKDITVLKIPVNDIAAELGNEKMANIVMMGAIWQVMQMTGKNAQLAQIAHQFEGKEAVIAVNQMAFEEGAKRILA